MALDFLRSLFRFGGARAFDIKDADALVDDDSALARCLSFTSVVVPLTATRRVTLNVEDGAEYDLSNDTSGGQTVRVAGPNGGYVDIRPGQAVFAVLKNGNVVARFASQQAAPISLLAGVGSTAQTSFQGIGAVPIDPTKYLGNPTFTFVAMLEATAGMTAAIQLYDLTAGAVVSGSLLTTTNTSTTKLTGTITLPSTEHIYEVQIRISAGSPGSSDRATCKCARVDVTF